MTLQSAFDDFVLNTLAAFPGVLAKLDYVSGLRQADGAHSHWGLARLHGESAARKAAAEAHQGLFARVLSTPLSVLLQDASAASAAQQRATSSYLQDLLSRTSDLAPALPGRAPALHFNSVLQALWALARSQERSSPGASQSPPPAQ